MNVTRFHGQIADLGKAVLSDPRWTGDTLSVAILGMILYGYALAIGRMVLMLDEEEVGKAVVTFLVNDLGAAERWSTGLVVDAKASAFDKDHHPGNHELVGVGHSYFGIDDRAAILDNVFANIDAYRT
jgi:hypothetical protein